MSRQGKKPSPKVPGKSSDSTFDRSWETVFLKDDPEHSLEQKEDSFHEWMEKALDDFDFSSVAKSKASDVQSPGRKRPDRFAWENAPVLDLHGMNREQSIQLIMQFLSVQKRAKVKWAKIVVGKGHHSDSGRAILRDTAEHLLIGMKRNGQIGDWFWEKKDKLKSGALLVRTQT